MELLALITNLARRFTILLLTRPLTTLLSSEARLGPPFQLVMGITAHAVVRILPSEKGRCITSDPRVP